MIHNVFKNFIDIDISWFFYTYINLLKLLYILELKTYITWEILVYIINHNQDYMNIIIKPKII